MAKGQHLTSHQRGIVNRYYEHLDTIQLQKLGEIVSDLYVASDGKAKDRLWKRAETALKKTGMKPGEVERILADRRVESLAALVSELSRQG